MVRALVGTKSSLAFRHTARLGRALRPRQAYSVSLRTFHSVKSLMDASVSAARPAAQLCMQPFGDKDWTPRSEVNLSTSLMSICWSWVEPTDAALKLWRSLGLTELERQWQKINFRVLGDVAALTKSVGTSWSTETDRTNDARAASWMLTPFETSANNFHGLSVEVATIFQPKDDDAVVTLRASDATIFQWRDVKTLNWLYFGTSYVSQTRVVLVARSGGALVGYLAMKSWGSGASLAQNAGLAMLTRNCTSSHG